MNKVSIDDLNFRGRRVLVRVDFNVPMDERLAITDDRRIREALPTIRKIIGDGGRAILCSHLGRPKNKPTPEFSLKPVATQLTTLIGKPVSFAEDCVGPEAANVVARLADGDMVLLENLRFHAGEEANDPEFARKLASLAELYVNDAFGSAHRAHASTAGVAAFFDQAIAGYLMKKELDYLGKAIEHPARPLAAILGGAKISGKIDVITNLLDKVDSLFIGGGMVFTFAKAMGYVIGGSLLEADKLDLAKEILSKINSSRAKLFFPVDAVVASEISATSTTAVVPIDRIPAGMKGLDIGPDTVRLFSDKLADARTVVWNGPMGVFEYPPFAHGTLAIAKLLAELTANGAITIVGGGDSAAAVAQAGLDDKLSHISTGGGASLEFLEGKRLPGVDVLTDLTAIPAR